MKLLLTNQIKKDILNYIDKNNGAFYGDIVKHLDYPVHKIMKTLLDLKKKGLVYKDNDGGRYKLI